MEIYLKLFEVLFPVFFIVGIGIFLGKKNPNFDTSFITTYSGNFGTPALVIFALTAGGVTFEVFKEFFIYGIILLTCFGIIGLIKIPSSLILTPAKPSTILSHDPAIEVICNPSSTSLL